MKSPLTFAKIVATPTVSSWSQAYNAGNLAAVISITQEPVESTEEGFERNLSLPSLGKELLNTLEAEYFTIESKNLESIKQAIVNTCQKLTGPLTLTLAVSVIIENILYVYLYGQGHVLMRRHGKLGTLLKQDEDGVMTSGSGFIENGDVVILETPQFELLVPQDVLLPCLEHDRLSDMAEILSPTIHKHQEGGAAALAFSYTEDVVQPATTLQANEGIKEETLVADDFVLPEETQLPSISSAPPIHAAPREKHSFPVSHSRKLFLTIALILAVVLVASVFFAIKKQQDAARQAVFASAIVPAQKKYDEGQSLMDLNKSLARDDFQSAKSMLDSVMGQLPKSSTEYQQAQDLLQKITTALDNTAQTTAVTATPVDASTSPLLAAWSTHATSYGAIDGTTSYFADNTSITSIKNGASKTAIKNPGDWTDIGGFGAYLGNFYLLDKKAGIIKYPGGATPKANYFASGVTPDLSKATDLTIDGSIWILTTDGSVTKYTKGNPDDFTLKGLDKPLTRPSRIVTSVDDNNVYILDNGNERIVIFDKNGNFIAQYQSGVLSSATAMDVHEQDKKIYVLSGGKVYEIDIK